MINLLPNSSVFMLSISLGMLSLFLLISVNQLNTTVYSNAFLLSLFIFLHPFNVMI